MLGKSGLFNYIPKSCPEWEKNNRCISGDNCPRAHGWSEIVFHPLLYKTKMCAYQRFGLCRNNHCAKAHNETEIRRHVKIFGWNWKRHYDLSLREGCTKSTNKSVSTVDKSVGHKEVGLNNSEIILKYLEGFPSELSDFMRRFTLKNRSLVVNNTSKSGSLCSASLSYMELNGEVPNYEVPVE